MVIDKLSTTDLPIDILPAAPPLVDTPGKDPINTQNPDLTYNHDPTKRKTQKQVFGVENKLKKAYCRAIGLYHKHQT